EYYSPTLLPQSSLSLQIVMNRRLPALHLPLEPCLIVALNFTVAFRRQTRVAKPNMRMRVSIARRLELDAQFCGDAAGIDPHVRDAERSWIVIHRDPCGLRSC